MPRSPERILQEESSLHLVSQPEENIVEFPRASEKQPEPLSIESAYTLAVMIGLRATQEELQKRNAPLLEQSIIDGLDEEFEQQQTHGHDSKDDPEKKSDIHEDRLKAWEDAYEIIASESLHTFQKKQHKAVRPLLDYLHALYECDLYSLVKPRPPQTKR